MPYDTKIHSSMDAREWTKLWLETIAEHPEIATNEASMLGWFANAIMAGHDAAIRRRDDVDGLTASEAVYGFAGWLTTQISPTVFGATANCAVVVERVAQFCETNQLQPPREDWAKRLIHPRSTPTEPGA